ncbi:hypothetical protein AB0910_19970 [Streptomyces sp. NPDC047002]|uniref:hypothetical protein n=1 Tax=Streptomyces sp. NPDC047002 TaxID=3155475 RepID=UPI003453FC70
MNPALRAAVGARLLRAAVFAAVCAVLSAVGHAMAACASVPRWSVVAGFLLLLAAAAPLAGRTRSTAGTVAALAAGQLGLHALFGLAQQRAAAPAPAGGDAVVRTAATLVCGAGHGLSHAQALRVLTRAHISPESVTAASGGAAGTVSDTASAMPPMPGMAGMPGMGGGTGSAAGWSWLAGLLPSLPMLLAHLLAALAAGWLLRRGDLALLRLCELSEQGAEGLGEVRETLTDAARLRSLRAALTLVRHLLAGLPGARVLPPGPPLAHRIPAAPSAVALQHTVVRRGPPAAVALAA